MRAVWVEVNETAFRDNISFLSSLVSLERLSLVIKANAYGHGLKEVATMAGHAGVKVLCVHSVAEAEVVRSIGFAGRIIVIGPVFPGEEERVIRIKAEVSCYTTELLRRLQHAARENKVRIPIHVKLETGTNRQGVTEGELPSFLEVLSDSSSLRLHAVYSHFANIEDTTSSRFAKVQLARFNALYRKVVDFGFHNVERHFASSAASLLYPETHFDMVRIGIAQYGLWPSKETYLSFITAHGQKEYLTPVLSLKCRVAQVKSVAAGESVGYGCTATLSRSGRIAVLPVGYSDGYFRVLSNRSRVLVHGQYAPVIGRIAMNLMMIDVTDIPDVAVHDEVVLLGSSGDKNISAEELAEHAGTINYEVVTAISTHIPRIVV